MPSTLELIRKVKNDLHELTGFTADSVSEVNVTEDGWEIIVNLLELKRIPASTDLLAAYASPSTGTATWSATPRPPLTARSGDGEA